MGLAVVLVAVGAGVDLACSPSAKQLPPDDFTLPAFDGSTFTLTEESGTQPARVLVLGASGPESGKTVVFEDSTGAVIDTATTDALGRAARQIAPGTQVTVLFGDATAPAAVTYVAAQPGDLLVALDPSVAYGPSADEQIATLPALPSQIQEAGSVMAYSALAGSCATYYEELPFDLYLTPLQCSNALGQFPLLVLAEGQNGDVAYLFQRGNDVVTDGGVGGLAVNGTWSTTFGTWNLQATNAPASAPYATGYFSEVTGGVMTWSSSNLDLSAGDGGVAPVTFTTHPGFADFVQSEIGVFDNTGGAYTAIATRAPAPAQSGSATLDFAGLLPLVTDATADYQTDPAHPTVKWTYATGTGGSAGTLVTLQWSEWDFDAGISTQKQWMFVVPPGATSLKAPSLPSANTAWTVVNFNGSNTPVIVSTDTTTGFGADDFRQLAASLPFPNWNYFYNSPFIPPLPADGATLRLTTYGPPPG